MKDSLGDGSGCTMLISAWRDTIKVPVKHTRRQAALAAAQNATKDEAVVLQVCMNLDSESVLLIILCCGHVVVLPVDSSLPTSTSLPISGSW